jgi:hypothetical protein
MRARGIEPPLTEKWVSMFLVEFWSLPLNGIVVGYSSIVRTFSVNYCNLFSLRK